MSWFGDWQFKKAYYKNLLVFLDSNCLGRKKLEIGFSLTLPNQKRWTRDKRRIHSPAGVGAQGMLKSPQHPWQVQSRECSYNFLLLKVSVRTGELQHLSLVCVFKVMLGLPWRMRGIKLSIMPSILPKGSHYSNYVAFGLYDPRPFFPLPKSIIHWPEEQAHTLRLLIKLI